VQEARERWRRELKAKGDHEEMFAKEAEWKEKSKALKTGMTLQEVIAIMGLPSQVQAISETDKETADVIIVPSNAISNVIGMAFVYYSPDGEAPLTDGTIGQR